MDLNRRIAAIAERLTPQLVELRKQLHQHPELAFEEHETAKAVGTFLNGLGIPFKAGVGKTGIVALLEGSAPGRTIGIRADMDALPIHEESGKPWASQVSGKMHACGHDGHTAMLLGAARYLAETRRFSGKAVFIFQPAEEGGAGGRAMVADGMMDRFGIEEVYGMHNMPGLPLGHFAIRPGALMASTDQFTIALEGHGGHAAKPHATIDPIVTGAAIVQALQSIVSRNVDPLHNAVVSVTTFNAGDTFNVIPQRGKITGTARSLDPLVRDLLERRMREIVQNVAAAYGATPKFHYERNYPVTVNHVEQTAKAVEIAQDVAGAKNVDDNHPPVMGGEDFSYMLEARPGAFIFLGNGDSAGLHHPAYDFNDAAISYGSSYWARLVERLLG